MHLGFPRLKAPSGPPVLTSKEESSAGPQGRAGLVFPLFGGSQGVAQAGINPRAFGVLLTLPPAQLGRATGIYHCTWQVRSFLASGCESSQQARCAQPCCWERSPPRERQADMGGRGAPACRDVAASSAPQMSQALLVGHCEWMMLIAQDPAEGLPQPGQLSDLRSVPSRGHTAPRRQGEL